MGIYSNTLSKYSVILWVIQMSSLILEFTIFFSKGPKFPSYIVFPKGRREFDCDCGESRVLIMTYHRFCKKYFP